MNFKLSNETLNLLYKSTYKPQPYKNKSHLNLTPRNIYLAQGRILKLETVERYIENIGISPFKKFCNWFKNTYLYFKKFDR